MNESYLSSNRSLLYTSTPAIRLTTSRIPLREQILIDNFNTYVQIGIGSILFLFGLTFNSLSLLYFRASRSFRHTTFQLYFSIISILDTVRLLEFVVFILFDLGYLHVTLQLCRWIFFAIMFTGQASIWLTVALAVEKCIIIWFPIKGRLCFTISISKLVLVLVLLLVFLADVIYLLPSFFLRTYENRSIHTFMCIWQINAGTPQSQYENWKKRYFTFNTIFFHSLIPSILLLIINWLILCSLSRQRVFLSKIGTIDARHVLKREKQFKEKTIQLVLSSFFVIFTISPRYVLTMVNAFAANITRKPIMPLYVYVNLNTVFRVLEMSNYSLNLMFAIISGRTSRREIRKLLSECIFWRCRRAKHDRKGSRINTNSFLFDDDDDDMERSAGTSGGNPYSTLPSSLQSRNHRFSRQSSHGANSIKRSSSSSVLTCCGVKVNLSNKHSSYSSPTGELSSRHSIMGKTMPINTNGSMTGYVNPHNYYSPSKTRCQSQSPMSRSSCDRCSGYHKRFSYRGAVDYHRATARRRSTTAVHCFQHLPSSARRSIREASSIYNHESKITGSTMSKEIDSSLRSISQTNTTFESPLITSIDANNPDTLSIKDTINSNTSVQNQIEETLPPAYIIETC